LLQRTPSHTTSVGNPKFEFRNPKRVRWDNLGKPANNQTKIAEDRGGEDRKKFKI
jgi:hypothetical protein